jgi:hypothetical protein
MESRYPLKIFDDRHLSPDFRGDVFVWDIDKTYLSTHFSSMKGLARIPLEFAVDKSAIAGMPEVLRGLRRGPGPTFAAAPIYFVSSSPPQLKGVIERKMLIDGVQPDGFTFKNWGATLRQLRPDRLKDHLGYKLCALLMGRRSRPLCREFLFGDDAERDAETYALYASILAHERDARAVLHELITGRVKPDDRGLIFDLIDELPEEVGQVGRVFIHLTKGTTPDDLEVYGPRICPVHNGFQLALALFQLGLIDVRSAQQARMAYKAAFQATPEQLEQQIDDAVTRDLIAQETLAKLGVSG